MAGAPLEDRLQARALAGREAWILRLADATVKRARSALAAGALAAACAGDGPPGEQTSDLGGGAGPIAILPSGHWTDEAEGELR